MVNSTKVFEYDGTSSTSFTPSIINATLNNDMYEFAPLGVKSIREQKVQGRDIPYFYNIEYEPMSFNMTIAFENYATQAEVNDVIKWLYLPRTPKLLKFPEYGLNYFGLFIGQPKFYYVGNNLNGYKFIGYIEVQFRANAPYGWTDLIEQTETIINATGDIHTTTNTGDFEIFPSFTIKNNDIIETPPKNLKIKIENDANGTFFEYSILQGETLTFNGYTKILSSSIEGKNPYSTWWNKDYLLLDKGDNDISISFIEPGTHSIEMIYKFRAPKIL